MKFRVSTNTVVWIEAANEEEAIRLATEAIVGDCDVPTRPDVPFISVEDVYDVTEIEEVG